MHDMFFSTLDKSYCNLFLFFAILGLVALVLTVFVFFFNLLWVRKIFHTHHMVLRSCRTPHPLHSKQTSLRNVLELNEDHILYSIINHILN